MIGAIPYNKPVTYLRLTRVGSKISAKASTNGHNWTSLMSDYVFELPDEARVFLYGYSTASRGTQATFSDVWLTPPVAAEARPGEGVLTFQDAADVSLLSSWWGWYPGASAASDFEVGEDLEMITGPATALFFPFVAPR